MAQIEKRVKLSDRQYQIVTEANATSQKALKAFEDAQRHLSTISALLLDSKGLPESLQARIDEATKELVFMADEEPTKPDADK